VWIDSGEWGLSHGAGPFKTVLIQFINRLCSIMGKTRLPACTAGAEPGRAPQKKTAAEAAGEDIV
jgi:hypothetical protein